MLSSVSLQTPMTQPLPIYSSNKIQNPPFPVTVGSFYCLLSTWQWLFLALTMKPAFWQDLQSSACSHCADLLPMPWIDFSLYKLFSSVWNNIPLISCTGQLILHFQLILHPSEKASWLYHLSPPWPITFSYGTILFSFMACLKICYHIFMNMFVWYLSIPLDYKLCEGNN